MTAWQPTHRPVKSNPPGTLPCAGAMSDASVLALLAVAPREPVVPALLVPVVLVVPVLLPLEPQLPALVPLGPSPLPLLPHLAVGAVEAGALQLLSRQSLSAAMAGSSPSPAEPTYEQV